MKRLLGKLDGMKRELDELNACMTVMEKGWAKVNNDIERLKSLR